MLVGFAREPDDDVGSDADIGHAGAKLVHDRLKALHRIKALHGLENGIVARLERHMNVLHDLRAVANRLNDVGFEISRIGRCVANAFNAVNFGNQFEKSRKWNPALGQIF